MTPQSFISSSRLWSSRQSSSRLCSVHQHSAHQHREHDPLRQSSLQKLLLTSAKHNPLSPEADIEADVEFNPGLDSDLVGDRPLFQSLFPHPRLPLRSAVPLKFLGTPWQSWQMRLRPKSRVQLYGLIGLGLAGLTGISVGYARKLITDNSVWISGTRVTRAEASEVIATPSTHPAFDPAFDPAEMHSERPLATVQSAMPQVSSPASTDRLRNDISSSDPSTDAALVTVSLGEASQVLSGELATNTTQIYRLQVEQSENVAIALQGLQVTLKLLNAKQQPLATNPGGYWEGTLPTGSYDVQVQGSGTYILSIKPQL